MRLDHRERAREVVDRVGPHVLEPLHLGIGSGIEFVDAEKPIDLGVIGEVEPMPVDHGVAAQHEAHRVRIGERELVG